MHPWLLRLVAAGTDSSSMVSRPISGTSKDLDGIKVGPSVVDLIAEGMYSSSAALNRGVALEYTPSGLLCDVGWSVEVYQMCVAIYTYTVHVPIHYCLKRTYMYVR